MRDKSVIYNVRRLAVEKCIRKLRVEEKRIREMDNRRDSPSLPIAQVV